MPYVKERPWPESGSISAALGSFQAEVRFYREIAPVVNIRVPLCYEAVCGPDGTRLVLEDLSSWREGGKPEAVAHELQKLHKAWEGQADRLWPWLRPAGAAVDLIGRLYDETWPRLAMHRTMPEAVRAYGWSLRGRVEEAQRLLASIPGRTLVHGDASGTNVRTSSDGIVTFLDWEDVSCLPAAVDVAWFLVSTVESRDWCRTIGAYGPLPGLPAALPSALVQGFLSFAEVVAHGEEPDGARAAESWLRRLEHGVKMAAVP